MKTYNGLGQRDMQAASGFHCYHSIDWWYSVAVDFLWALQYNVSHQQYSSILWYLHSE